MKPLLGLFITEALRPFLVFKMQASMSILLRSGIYQLG